MKTWRVINSSYDSLEGTLNSYSKEGWEVYKIDFRPFGVLIIFFKEAK